MIIFNETATTEICTLSLHVALPICRRRHARLPLPRLQGRRPALRPARADREGLALRRRGRGRASALEARRQDRKSTRLNSSHANISYAVFCLIKKHNTSASPPHPVL